MPKNKDKKSESKSKSKSKVKEKAPTKALEKKGDKKKLASPQIVVATHEQIAKRAYELWLRDGCPEGCAEKHWAEAQKQLVGA